MTVPAMSLALSGAALLFMSPGLPSDLLGGLCIVVAVDLLTYDGSVCLDLDRVKNRAARRALLVLAFVPILLANIIVAGRIGIFATVDSVRALWRL